MSQILVARAVCFAIGLGPSSGQSSIRQLCTSSTGTTVIHRRGRVVQRRGVPQGRPAVHQPARHQSSENPICSASASADGVSSSKKPKELLLKRADLKSDQGMLQLEFDTTLGRVGISEADGAMSPSQPVRVSTIVTRVRSDYHIKGRTRTELRCQCDRCLSPFDLDAKGEFQIWLTSKENQLPQTDGNDDDRADEAIERFTPEVSSIDLSPHVYDSIILSIPFKKLCSPNCIGIQREKQASNDELAALDSSSSSAVAENAESESFEDQLQKAEEGLGGEEPKRAEEEIDWK